MLRIVSTLLFLCLVYSCAKESVDNFNGTNGKNNSNGKSGSITRFTTYNDYLYVLDHNKIKTYYTGDGNLTLTSTVTTDYGLETITIYDGTIYIGSRTGLYILDITNPSYPVLLSKTERSDIFGRCDPVVIKGHYAYSTVKTIVNVCGTLNTISALITYDVSNKHQPQEIDVKTMEMPNGLGIYKNLLFVCDEGDDAIHVFDISNNIPVPFVKVSITNPRDVICHNGKMIVSTPDGFTFYDIRDPSNIRMIGKIQT
ncbi:MAG: hypothetical protein NZM35_05045 [Chitinophagales bacterium]|nr:hypothetical protein [Chitinophagales bacterium]MDW8418589.1 hypothetical protein [Chitinophagales bacterium]